MVGRSRLYVNGRVKMRVGTNVILLLGGFISLSGCSDSDSDITGLDIIPPEDGVLFINEIMPGNDGVIADENAESDDWFEVFNSTSEPVDIGGMYVTDDLTLPIGEWWQIPDTDPSATVIPPGGHLVLWADGQPGQGALHVDFKLSGSGESIGLVDSDGATTLDAFTFSAISTDVSYGRWPDGSDTWQAFDPATPGGSNSFVSPTLYLNEFLADNDSTGFADDAGEFEDWIEIYNSGTESIDIGGMYVTDDLTDLTKSQIPTTDAGSTTIQPGGFLIIWADDDPEQGVLHLDWKLSGDGEEIGLVAPNGTGLVVVDGFSFDAQTEGVSQGRSPDGGDIWVPFVQPTPGATNG